MNNNKNQNAPVKTTGGNIRQITEAQSKVLLFISNYIDLKRYPPSYRDISAGLKFASTNAVTNHLVSLENKGFITTEHNRARALVLTERAMSHINSCKKAKTN